MYRHIDISIYQYYISITAEDYACTWMQIKEEIRTENLEKFVKFIKQFVKHYIRRVFDAYSTDATVHSRLFHTYSTGIKNVD